MTKSHSIVKRYLMLCGNAWQKNTPLHPSQEGNRTGSKSFVHISGILLTGVGCGLLFIFLLPGCKPHLKETGASQKYFDVKGYFERDSARLTKTNHLVSKSVFHNGVEESKRVHIDNWGTELSLFKESDINRPAWRDSYYTIAEGNILIYKAKFPELKTREIMIKRVDGKVVYMLIYNHIKNLLYTNDEELTYFPDSLYQINKVQSVRLLGTNKYQIKGFFN